MSLMTEQQHPEPSHAEQLAADYPHADIHRELLPDGSHGMWVAHLELRASTLDALRELLSKVTQLSSRGTTTQGSDR